MVLLPFFSIFSFTSWPHGLVCSDSHLHLALSSICLCVLCACGINREQPKISLCLISLIWRKLFLFAQSPMPNSNKNDGKNAHSKRYALGESEMEQVSRVATCMCDTTKWPPWVPFFLLLFSATFWHFYKFFLNVISIIEKAIGKRPTNLKKGQNQRENNNQTEN